MTHAAVPNIYILFYYPVEPVSVSPGRCIPTVGIWILTAHHKLRTCYAVLRVKGVVCKTLVTSMRQKADRWVLEDKKKKTWVRCGLRQKSQIYMQGYVMTVALRENKYPMDEAQVNLVKFWYLR